LDQLEPHLHGIFTAGRRERAGRKWWLRWTSTVGGFQQGMEGGAPSEDKQTRHPLGGNFRFVT